MNIFQSLTKKVADVGGAVANTASQAGEAIVGTATGVGEAMAGVASQAGEAVVGTATGVGEAMATAASQAGETVVGIAVVAGGAVNSAAIQAGRATADTVVKTGPFAVTQAVKLAGATSSAAIQAGQTVVGITTKTGSEAIALAMSRILQECTVPAFLLPTGSGNRDFKCTFDFDEAITKLTSGTLVRPQVLVWAGRTDIDRDRLAQILKKGFIHQFNAAREQSRAANQNAYADKIASLKRQQEQNGQEAGKALQSAVKFVATALLFMFFVANPIFNLIFFSLAIFGSVDGITKGLNYLRLSFQVSGDSDKLKREQQKLEADFDSRNQAFAQAVNNMTIHVHPVLQDIITLFNELDNTPFLPVNTELSKTEFPPVNELLAMSDYRREVPVEYLPLLDVVQQE